MRSFVIPKNQSLYRWLRRRMVRERALRGANAVEKIVLKMDSFFLISLLTIEGVILFWIFLVFINVTSF
jgi:hypothetical protein